MKKYLLLLLVAIMLAFPGGASAQTAPGDIVDTSGHWAEQDIEAVSCLGFMNGTGTTDQGFQVFSPEGTVSRAQLAAVLQRTFQLDYGQIQFIKQPLASDYYPDVDNDAWYANGLVMCAINNIFEITGDFSADRSVSRMEMARSIYRCFNAKEISVPMIMLMPIYEDTNSLSQEDVNAITFVSNTGIMKGENNYFRPEQDMTRAELARVLNRCVSLMAINESYNGQEYQLPVGQTLIISLSSNPTTGYTWNIKNAGDEKILSPIGNTYLGESNENQLRVGQGGQQYWRFKALQAGTTELQLVYARPWESVQPARVFTLKVTVKQPTISSGATTISCNSVKEESDHMSVDLNIPVITGLADNSIQANLNALWEKDAMELKTKLVAEIEDYVKYNQNNDFPIRPYELLTRYQETYQIEKIMSLYVDYYQYTGGAHGITDRRNYNMDLVNGKQLALKDLFQDGYDYQSIINNEVRQQIAANPDKYFAGNMGFNGIAENQRYYIQPGFLVVYFSHYEIAPYAAGIPEFKIPLAKFPDGVRAELLK
ncbi:MAG: protease inhibitor I42 family protein [Syntrophomonas sp.]|nr:protease inhibitor I42 family protein [Syntrophomonas sp.]